MTLRSVLIPTILGVSLLVTAIGMTFWPIDQTDRLEKQVADCGLHVVRVPDTHPTPFDNFGKSYALVISIEQTTQHAAEEISQSAYRHRETIAGVAVAVNRYRLDTYYVHDELNCLIMDDCIMFGDKAILDKFRPSRK